MGGVRQMYKLTIKYVSRRSSEYLIEDKEYNQMCKQLVKSVPTLVFVDSDSLTHLVCLNNVEEFVFSVKET